MDSCSLASRPVLETEKLKREPIPIPIIETTRKSGPLKLEPELETNSQPVHSKYIHNVLRRKLSHDPTFGVYQNDTDGSFKNGSSSSKYTDKHVFVDGRMYKATQGLCELLTKSKPDKNVVSFQDKQAYKQILLHSNAHRVNYSPTGKIKANKGVEYTRFISQLFTDKKEVPWESV